MVPPTESLRFVAGELGKSGRNLEQIGAKFLGPNRFGVFFLNMAERLPTCSHLGHIGKLEANLDSFKTALSGHTTSSQRKGIIGDFPTHIQTAIAKSLPTIIAL